MVELNLTNLLETESGVISGKDSKIRIQASGHSGFNIKGADIVCAAISAIIQTAIVSITRVAGIHQDIKQKQGCLESIIIINKLDNNKLNDLLVIVNSMLIGLDEIIKIYPDALKIYYK